RRSVLEAGDNLRRSDITGDPTDKYVSNGLIENRFDRYAGIRACEHCSKRFLLIRIFGAQHCKIVFVSRDITADVPPVSLQEFAQSLFWCQGGLGRRERKCGKLHQMKQRAGRHYQAGTDKIATG